MHQARITERTCGSWFVRIRLTNTLEFAVTNTEQTGQTFTCGYALCAREAKQGFQFPCQIGESELRHRLDLIRYLSGLTVTQGRLAGQAFRVLLWQRRFMSGAFRPGVQSAALSVGRGNGKTALLSGIACATLDGPLAVPRGETVIVASSFEQARIGFEHCLAFMGEKLDDRERWKIWGITQLT